MELVVLHCIQWMNVASLTNQWRKTCLTSFAVIFFLSSVVSLLCFAVFCDICDRVLQSSLSSDDVYNNQQYLQLVAMATWRSRLQQHKLHFIKHSCLHLHQHIFQGQRQLTGTGHPGWTGYQGSSVLMMSVMSRNVYECSQHHKSMDKYASYIFYRLFLCNFCYFFPWSLGLLWVLWDSFDHCMFTAIITVFWRRLQQPPASAACCHGNVMFSTVAAQTLTSFQHSCVHVHQQFTAMPLHAHITVTRSSDNG